MTLHIYPRIWLGLLLLMCFNLMTNLTRKRIGYSIRTVYILYSFLEPEGAKTGSSDCTGLDTVSALPLCSSAKNVVNLNLYRRIQFRYYKPGGYIITAGVNTHEG